jgi:hypothetical protein
MPRVSLIGPETASQEVRQIYDTTLRGKPGNVPDGAGRDLNLPRISRISTDNPGSCFIRVYP